MNETNAIKKLCRVLSTNLQTLSHVLYLQIRLTTNNKVTENVLVSIKNDTTLYQNVTFHDDNPGWDCNILSQPDSTYDYGKTQEMSLNDFFSRPIKITSGIWSIGASLLTVPSFDPWTLFFSNKRVINRINNYHLLRCVLKIKIVINGTPFHYGKMLMSYRPIDFQDTVSKLPRATFFIQDVIERSQRPHIFLDPTMDQGATMSLPFFFYKNWLSIIDSEWSKMGDLTLDIVVPLAHANGGTGDVSYSVYAWAENVVVSVPTTNNSSSLVTQSGNEYGKGIISTKASAVSMALGRLNNVPVIGPYAKATSMVADFMSDIAKVFGYSRPNILDAVKPVRPVTFGNLSNTDADDFSMKLSVDSKQELTVDSRTVGLSGEDEMTIQSIATRMSYYTQFPWSNTAIQEQMLFTTYVHPIMYDHVLTEMHSTALCFAAMPFKYWTGSIIYRFQVVASPYHKGRLKIVYDPRAISTATAEYNTAFTRIVDISKEKDFELTIDWAQETAFLQMRLMSTGYKMFSTTTPLAASGNFSNGVLAIYVVNELTAPALAPTDISVIVSVAGGPNIQFAVPTEVQLTNLSYFPTPPLTVQSGEMDCNDCPGMANEIEGVRSSDNKDVNRTYDVYMGEVILSFRNLLKRYNRTITYSPSLGATTNRYVTILQSNYPLYYGPSPTGVHTQSAVPWNITNNGLFNYLAPAYVGMRGAVRYKIFRTVDTAFTNSHTSVIRSTGSGALLSITSLVYNPTTQSAVATNARKVEGSMLNGAVVNSNDNGTILEYELPYYNHHRFTGTKNITHATNDLSLNQHQHAIVFPVHAGAVNMNMTNAFAVGEDFTFFFYTGPPIFYAQIVI